MIIFLTDLTEAQPKPNMNLPKRSVKKIFFIYIDTSNKVSTKFIFYNQIIKYETIYGNFPSQATATSFSSTLRSDEKMNKRIYYLINTKKHLPTNSSIKSLTD